jgi:hypothetical protein
MSVFEGTPSKCFNGRLEPGMVDSVEKLNRAAPNRKYEKGAAGEIDE